MTDVEQEKLKQVLDDIIRRTVPRAETVPKYGGVLYTLKPEEKEGQFCGVFPYKDHVQLAFSNGTELSDPQNVLTGTGKMRRHINFSKPEDVDINIVSGLLRQAAGISDARN